MIRYLRTRLFLLVLLVLPSAVLAGPLPKVAEYRLDVDFYPQESSLAGESFHFLPFAGLPL